MGKHGSQKDKNLIIRLFKDNHIEKACLKLNQLLNAHPRDYELHYIAGMIYSSQNRYTDAIRSFEEALCLNPNHAHSYFELGIIHLTLCRFNKAKTFFQKAKVLKYNLAETNSYLKRIQKVAKSKDATLSACLIVKNEEKLLPNCLKSIQAVSDEIVVVDTGSTDGTVAIAKEFGAKVYHYKWNEDFAAARNFTNKKATGDWILQIDADEELYREDQFKVRELIHQNLCDGAFVALHCKNSTMFGENQPTVHYLVRIYKNREDFYYINPVHEVLQYSGDVIPVDINFLHHGYNLDPDYMKQKRQRNAEILYKRLQQDSNHVASNFYLSMLHLANKEFELCETFAKRVIEKINPDDVSKQHIFLMALNNLAIVHVEKEDFDAAKNYCQQAIKINDNYLDPQFFLGLCYFREKNFPMAKKVFNHYLEKFEVISRNPVFNLFINSSSAYLYEIYHILGKIYRKEKDYQTAQKMFSKALELNPSFWLGYADLGYLYLDLKEWQNAALNLEKAIQLAKANPEVNQKNEELWFDFSNLLKIYAFVLKTIFELKNREKALIR
jgi:glycosyltransferase involved in cell wall biosynthesis